MITIKIGGSVVDNLHPSTISDIKKVAEEEGLILVHGGGKEVTKVTEQLGKEPKFVVSPSGIKSRYTDKETSEIFTMVMSGRINKTIVQMLQKNGINAIGLSGMDGKTIEANRKKKLMIMNEKGRKQMIDGGYTGKISNVNADLIKTIMDKGYTPVISPIAISEESEFLNVDGDRAAANVAGSFGLATVCNVMQPQPAAFPILQNSRLVAWLQHYVNNLTKRIACWTCGISYRHRRWRNRSWA